ncbi:hypothetical protein ACQQ6W_16175 [Lysinibacillus fusiformis]
MDLIKKIQSLKTLYVINFLLACIVFYLFDSYINLFQVKGISHALSGFLIFASISLGFFGTCIAILATLINSPIIKEVLRDKNYKKDLLYMFILTVFYGLTALISTVIFQVYLEETERTAKWEKTISSLWGSSMSGYFFSLAVFYMVIMILFFKSADDDPKVKAKENAKVGEPKKDLFKTQ